jgi:8-oxo-dGTP pyrophosphatase MutT (NUDIX family)
MILFACARDAIMPEIQRYGLRFSGLGHKLYRTLEGARRECGGKILVLELGPRELESCTLKERVVVAPLVALDAFRNLNPYLPPVAVAAGGGLVVRRRRGKHELVCIHRRGVWDLPKGKQDGGETIEGCALREVQEELGIEEVEVVKPAGQTVHGYTRSRIYHVKTTHWFWMRSGATSFEPQADEQIDEVQWVAWDEAASKLGYRTLRQLLRTLQPPDADL